jgi:hypothetical protein
MNQFAAFDETIEKAKELGMPMLEGTNEGLEHLLDMQARIRVDFSPSKLGRWLGWAQSALFYAKVGFTLEDAKQINMKWS